jgi:hypothetical protein
MGRTLMGKIWTSKVSRMDKIEKKDGPDPCTYGVPEAIERT